MGGLIAEVLFIVLVVAVVGVFVERARRGRELPIWNTWLKSLARSVDYEGRHRHDD
jgi:hypothetical protein